MQRRDTNFLSDAPFDAGELATALLQTAPILVAWLDTQGCIRGLNPCFEERSGYGRDALLGRDFVATLMPEREQARARQMLDATRSGRASPALTCSITTQDGSERAITWNSQVLRDAAGEVCGVLCTGVHAEPALSASRQPFEALVAASPVGVFEMSLDGACTFVNDRWCEITGYTPAQALGDGWVSTLHPDDRESVLRSWGQAAAALGSVRREMRLLRPDGVETWVFVQTVPLRSASGSIVGHLGTVTERQRAQASAERRAQRARAAAGDDGFLPRLRGPLRSGRRLHRRQSRRAARHRSRTRRGCRHQALGAAALVQLACAARAREVRLHAGRRGAARARGGAAADGQRADARRGRMVLPDRRAGRSRDPRRHLCQRRQRAQTCAGSARAE